ncbi:MAG: PAS/PAC sensor hybrid histidine kinase [candidate division TM6 bacterium GW2011_GWF2_33_332]|nr:MAG: PAS/PAC sensor hybrid histidine kinase [candidate division TM6 bacterium GW2011_GWF2_33_332]
MAYLGRKNGKQDDNGVFEKLLVEFPELNMNTENEKDFDLDKFAFTAALTEVTMETKGNFQRVGKKILVIDFDEVTVKLIREFFNTEYITILHARDEKEALLILEKTKIDLVLIEIYMQGADGFKIIEKIKSINRSLPVIVQTVFAMKHEKDLCVASGCDGYISKPYNKDEFEKIVDYWLKKRPIVNQKTPLKARNLP